MEKDYLNQKNISFVEKLVDQDDAARSEMQSLSGGFLGVPYTVIKKDDGGEEKVIGFDQKKLNEILNIS